jgi:DHA2 family multidrug resistance protein
LQGFIGGGMIPTVFASSFVIFPREKQPLVAPIVGLVVTLAPTIGPTVGGYLTDLFSWRWLFLVNVPPGIVVTAAAWTLIDFDEPDLSLLKNFDWTHLISMAVFLGSLEYVLEEGPLKDWFADDKIVIGSIACVLGGIVFLWRSFSSPQPIVDLRAFSNRNFATGSLFSFVMGVGLYGLTYVYPVFLARVRGYSALMIGETMFVTGVCMFLSAPIVGRLMTRVDPRLMIAVGFLGFGLGTFLASYITKDWDFHELLLPQILRGSSMMLCMVPINNLALGTLPASTMKNASALYNLTRNLGGAVGLALINTMINARWDLHIQRLRDSVSWTRPIANETVQSLAQALSALGSNAELGATRQMMLLVRREGLVMALSDVFLALTLLFFSLVLLTPLMRRPSRAGPNPDAH